MNKLQFIESIKEHHVNFSSRQCELYIERAANKIALDTNIVKKTFLISSVAGTRWYSLDTKVLRVDKVEFNDVRIPKLIGEPLIEDDEFKNPSDTADTPLTAPNANALNKRFWMLDSYSLNPYRTQDYNFTNDTQTDADTDASNSLRLGIVEKVNNSITRDGRVSDYQTCSITGSSNVRVYAITLPNEFKNIEHGAALSEDSGVTINSEFSGPLADIPKEFHEVILYGALFFGYQNPKSFNADMIGYFKNEFQQGIKDIKKFERTKGSTGFIRPQDF